MSDLPPESGDSPDDSNTHRDVRRVGRDDQKPELESHGPLFPSDDDPFAFNDDDDLFAFGEEDSDEAARSDAALLTLTPDDEVLLALDADARQQLAGLVGEVDMDTLLDIDPSLTAIGDDATKAQIEDALAPSSAATSTEPPEPPAAAEREIPEEDLPFAPPQVRVRRAAKPPTTAAEVDKALGEFKFEDEPGTVDAPLPPLNANADVIVEATPEAQAAPPPRPASPPPTAVEVSAKPSKPSRPSRTKATATGTTKAVRAA